MRIKSATVGVRARKPKPGYNDWREGSLNITVDFDDDDQEIVHAQIAALQDYVEARVRLAMREIWKDKTEAEDVLDGLPPEIAENLRPIDTLVEVEVESST